MAVSVVTGGAGFLGSHLCDHLLAEGHQVICMDNLITGNVANIEHLAGDEKFRFIKHDVTEYIYLPGRQECAVPAGVDIRDLRRSPGASATRDILGQRQPGRATWCLR